jgi:hypothetical protein
MTETIQQLKEDIALLQMKLQKLEEKSPAEEAFKRIYYRYPDKLDDEYGSAWDIFEKGYEAHQSLVDDANKIIKAVASMTNCIIEGNPPNGCSAWSEWFELFGSNGILHNLRISTKEYQPTPQEPEENKWKTVALRFGETLSSIGPCGYYEMTADEWLEWANDTYEKNADELLTLVQRGIRKNEVKEYQPKEKEQKWDVVRESVKWCEEHPDESVEDYLTPQTPDKIEENLREAFQKVQQTEEWKETQRKIDSNYDELVERGTTPPEPTSTVFRQKLFDGIKSVFYDPDYERTHWKLKVDMTVDEVLTHFYDILPEPQEPICDEFVKGWNCGLAEIKACMEFSDD